MLNSGRSQKAKTEPLARYWMRLRKASGWPIWLETLGKQLTKPLKIAIRRTFKYHVLLPKQFQGLETTKEALGLARLLDSTLVEAVTSVVRRLTGQTWLDRIVSKKRR